MEPMSPLVAVAGGALIGSAAALLLLLSGRIAGVSGMLAQASRITAGGTPWPIAAAFIGGLPLGAALVGLAVGPPDIRISTSVPLLIVAGLLVGFGTRLGNGCTSGHGVCGMARLSPRSIAATLTFMAAGFATVFLVRYGLGA